MNKTDTREHIPQVDKVLRHDLLENSGGIRREILAQLVRDELNIYRSQQLKNRQNPPSVDEIAQKVLSRAKALIKPRLCRVINGTGVVLNTNLGRAPLPKSAVQLLSETAGHYSNLEFELATGKRGERAAYIEEVLKLLTGCQAALVVNNNAAAVLLAVSSLAKGKEVVVSRGELIEIGGSFRLPEVIVAAGGKLKEIGTTNKTRISDYQQAISQTKNKTGILLRCHRSNFALTGFCEEANREQLVALSQESTIPLVEDLGSGALVEFFDSKAEPTISEIIASGVDIVTFSGDKLLGGPQAGIVVGKKSLIQQLRKNPLYRALRPDKMIIAVLESVLANYLTPELNNNPVLAMTQQTAEEIKARAEKFAHVVNKQFTQIQLQLTNTESVAGGGSLPGTSIASFGLVIKSTLSATRLANSLRKAAVPVIPLIDNERVIIDFRTITMEDEGVLLDSLRCIDELDLL